MPTQFFLTARTKKAENSGKLFSVILFEVFEILEYIVHSKLQRSFHALLHERHDLSLKYGLLSLLPLILFSLLAHLSFTSLVI